MLIPGRSVKSPSSLMKRNQRRFGESDFGRFFLGTKQTAPGGWRSLAKTRSTRAVGG
jgi:hypothetical protein